MGRITRRGMLRGTLGLACSAAAHPLTAPMTFAAVPGEARLVVIVLRGAMDGLGLLPPLGDPLLAAHRPTLARADALALDGFWGMHPAFAPLLPLWQAGELGFAQAVSTPYRDKRSHFDGQDLLEAGTGMDVAPGARRGGWLNRLLQALPGAGAETAFAVGDGEMGILRGAAPVRRWDPGLELEVTPQARLLLEHVYDPDPAFAAAAAEALDLAERLDRADLPPLASGARREPLAAFAADRLNETARIASYSLTGWDTHRGQARGLDRALDRLQRSILTLREGLGANWSRTAVLAVTEFGRTVAENGSGGTDHGTGGAMVMAGGALRGGRVFGDWPGLEEAALLDRRDLMPTADVRAYAAWSLRGLFGLDRALLEQGVFPGLDMGADPGLVL